MIWLHEDALRSDHPVFKAAGQDAAAFFIWDAEYLQRMDYGFKRLVFIYETLCELPVHIYRGATVPTLLQLAEQQETTTLYVPATPNPELLSMMRRLESQLRVARIEDESFVACGEDIPLRRFSRYWNKVKKQALCVNGDSGHRPDGQKVLFTQ
jgi:hypothetical protein